ncbi:hypothetical protein Droror1_Dr00007308 [Drosera rotundifolia]
MLPRFCQNRLLDTENRLGHFYSLMMQSQNREINHHPHEYVISLSLFLVPYAAKFLNLNDFTYGKSEHHCILNLGDFGFNVLSAFVYDVKMFFFHVGWPLLLTSDHKHVQQRSIFFSSLLCPFTFCWRLLYSFNL